jgi:nucleoside-diphosphate-sugar epimerase
MKILVTGATGFIGVPLSTHLAEKGLKPRLMVRRPARAALIKNLDAELVSADLERPETLAEAVGGVDAVIHMGARATFEKYDKLAPSIVGGTKALFEAAAEAGVKHFLYASSLLVYRSSDQAVDAATPPNPIVDYGQAKVDAENMLMEMAEAAGIDLAILRLPHVYGPCDLMFEQMRQGRIVIPGDGKNLFGHMHIDDCTRIISEATLQGWIGTSPIADDLAPTWNTYLDIIREHYHNFRTFHVPSWLAIAGTSLLEPLQGLFSGQSLYTPDAVRGWNLNVAIAPGLVHKDLGLDLLYPTVREGIPAALDAGVCFRWVHPVFDKSAKAETAASTNK